MHQVQFVQEPKMDHLKSNLKKIFSLFLFSKEYYIILVEIDLVLMVIDYYLEFSRHHIEENVKQLEHYLMMIILQLMLLVDLDRNDENYVQLVIEHVLNEQFLNKKKKT